MVKTSSAVAKPSHSPSPTSKPSSSGPSGDAIAGGDLGGIAGLGLLGLLAYLLARYCAKRKLKLKLKRRKVSNASEVEEKEKELKVREKALKEAEQERQRGMLSPSPVAQNGGWQREDSMYGEGRGGGYVIDRGMGSPTGTGESGSGNGHLRRRSDARAHEGQWI